MAKPPAQGATPSSAKSGKTMASIPAERLALLSSGQVESATLTEGLAVDFPLLLQAVFPQHGSLPERMKEGAGLGITRRMALAAQICLEAEGPSSLEALRTHPSDTARGWGCFVAAQLQGLSLPERLDLIRPLADDPHFGVREWAWLALRPHLAQELNQALELLAPWTGEGSDRLRRFASEATRPRGVWCSHIPELRANPERGLPLLEPLKSDPSRCVQDSVANWLNDAAKDRPDWVKSLCSRWTEEEPTDSCLRICRRALRSFKG